MQSMIFAAGLGTRLRPLTLDRPKALVEVGGATLLQHTILRLRDAGCRRIVVNVHHFADQVIAFLDAHNRFGLDIRVSDERGLLLDTGGGVRQALPLLSPDEPVLIHNVDIVSRIDLGELWRSHRPGQLATLAVNRRTTSRYLQFSPQMQLCGWQNVSTGEVRGQLGQPFAFTGIHVIDPTLFPLLMQQPAGEAFPIIPYYLTLCDQHVLRGVDVTDVPWVDCGRVESLDRAAQILATDS